MGNAVVFRVLPEGEGLPVPEQATPGSSGVDLFAAVSRDLILDPGERALVSAGVAASIPTGFEWQIRPRSRLSLRHGVTVLNSPGTVDCDYRGPVGVILVNLGDAPFVVHRGDRIAQAVLTRVEPQVLSRASSLTETERGDGGFGHTGV